MIDERALRRGHGHVVELIDGLAEPRIGEGEELHVVARRGLALDELIGSVDAELGLGRARGSAAAQPCELLAQEVLTP